MILRRIIEGFRRQDPAAIIIEFLIVVVGVGLGTIVADWNAERLDKREAARLLDRYADFLEAGFVEDDLVIDYYRVQRAWAQKVIDGLEDPDSIDDADFVIAAFQATQTIGNSRDTTFITNMLGADFARSIEDERMRDEVIRAMGDTNNSYFAPEVMETEYRQDVRSVVPPALQELLHHECGDRFVGTSFRLPETCDVEIAPSLAARTARRVRDIPDVAGKLAWHLAVPGTYLANIRTRKERDERLVKMIRTGNPTIGAWSPDEQIVARPEPEYEVGE